MPEGPEVKRISEQLNRRVKDQNLNSIHILSGRYLKKPPEDLDYLRSLLPLKISNVNCKGKFIYLQFENSEVNIWNTLGMTGSWKGTQNPHARLMFNFDCGDVFFSDIRNFGTFHIIRDQAKLGEKLNTLGHDILNSNMNFVDFDSLLRSKKFTKKTLSEFLMSQNGICGVGNYIKSESLYLAGLSPLRLCGSLSPSESSILLNSIRKIITTSYQFGGSTIQAYSDFNGQSGSFSSRFAVYQRQFDPIGNKITKVTTPDGRTSFYVPSVQK